MKRWRASERVLTTVISLLAQLFLKPVSLQNVCFFFFFFFLFFNFIFKLYRIVLVLPNIKMNPPQVYMC